jgi:hypothetical protein
VFSVFLSFWRVWGPSRLPRDPNLALNEIAGEVGAKPTTLVTQLAMIATKCDPGGWFAMLTAFQRAANGGAIKR